MPSDSETVILYVEDDPVNALLVQHVLASQRPRCVLHVAVDGRTGLEQAKRLRPCLVLIDMNLPDISGLEVLRGLRQEPATRALRCIALSANALPHVIDQARAAGFDGYWTKPIDIHAFVRQIDEQMASS